MANLTTGWNVVPVWGFFFKGDDITPITGRVKLAMTQRITRVDGRVVYPEGAVTERTIGATDIDPTTRNAVRAAWRAADEAAAIAAGETFDGAAWDTRWDVLLTGAVFASFPASDDPDIVQTGYQVKVEESLTGGGGKSYYIQPLLSDLNSVPPGINLGLIEVPPGSPTAPAPIYAKGLPGGVASLDENAKLRPEQWPDLGGGAVESVNGEVGAVTLSAADVGADPAGSAATAQATAVQRANHTGTQSADTLVDGTTNHAFTAADDAKLAGIVTGATANSSDATLLARTNHTGTQTSASISDFTEAVQDAVAALLGAGSNITLTYDDAANTLTVTGAAGSDPEAVRDAIGVALVGVGPISIAVDDAGDTITISTTATVNSTDAALRDRSTHTGAQAVSTVTGLQAELDAKIPLTQRGAADGVATLGADGVLPTAQLPPLAVNETFVVADQAAMLALAAQRGDMAVRTDNGRTYVLASDSPGTLADWKEVLAAGQVQSVNGQTGVVALTKSDVGLGSVDNTADADKPVSTAQQAAIDAAGGVNAAGTWNDATAYDTGDIVTANGSSYLALQTVPAATLLTDTAYWQLIAQAGADGAAGATGSGFGYVLFAEEPPVAGESAPFYPRRSVNIGGVTIQTSAPAGKSVTVDILQNGTTSVFTTPPTLDVGQVVELGGPGTVTLGPSDSFTVETSFGASIGVRDQAGGTGVAVYESNSTSTVPIPIPAGTQVGDRLVAFVAVNDAGPTNLGGWTLVDTTTVAGVANASLHRLERTATGTDGQTVTLASAKPVAAVTVAIAEYAATDVSSETAGPDANSLTITTGTPTADVGGVCLRAAAWRLATGGAIGTGSWSGGTELADVCSDAGAANNELLTVAVETVAAGAVPSRTATSTETGRVVSQTVVFEGGSAPADLTVDVLLVDA